MTFGRSSSFFPLKNVNTACFSNMDINLKNHILSYLKGNTFSRNAPVFQYECPTHCYYLCFTVYIKCYLLCLVSECYVW